MAGLLCRCSHNSTNQAFHLPSAIYSANYVQTNAACFLCLMSSPVTNGLCSVCEISPLLLPVLQDFARALCRCGMMLVAAGCGADGTRGGRLQCWSVDCIVTDDGRRNNLSVRATGNRSNRARSVQRSDSVPMRALAALVYTVWRNSDWL